MALVEALPTLDTLKHEAGWLEKGQWSKMTWATSSMSDSALGAAATGFGTQAGSYFNAATYKTHDAVSLVHNNGSPIAERFVSLWLCYNDGTHSGYRIKFVYVTETTMKAVLISVSAGVETTLGESATFTPEAGMILGAEKTSTSIEAWVKLKGAWTKLSVIANTTFTEGFIGIDGQGSNPTFTELAAKVEGATAPTLTNPGAQNSTEGVSIGELKLTATNTLTFHATGLPAGLKLNEVTGVITGTPTKAEAPTVTITAVGTGGGASQAFTWTVVSPPPTLSNPGTQVSFLNTIVTLPLSATHTTSFTASGLPPGLSINSTTGVITGELTTLGTYKPRVTAHGEGEVTVEWEWIVVLRPTPARNSFRDQFPFRLLIGGVDYTPLLSENFTFSNVDPGGFEAASFSLPMDLPQIKRNMNVRLDCGLKVAWEGRVKEVDRTLGVKTLIQCEGYGAKLKKETLREIYVARRIDEWKAGNVKQQISATEGGHTQNGPVILPNPAGAITLALEAIGAWEAAGAPGPVAFYDSQGIPLDNLYYEWESGPNVNTADTNWQWDVQLALDELFVTKDGGANLRKEGVKSGSGTQSASTSNRVYAALVFAYTKVAAGGAGVRYIIYWKNLALYGRHGLTKRGANPSGFYTSDIVSHAISKASGFQTGVIEQLTSFIVPHAVYLESVPIEQVISDMAKLAGFHWGVWEPLEPLVGSSLPRLDFRAYPVIGKPTAFVLRAECESIDIREDLENLYNKAEVTYTEAEGLSRVVTVTLDNPQLDAIGLNQTLTLNMGTGTQASAEAFGKIVLALLQDQGRVTGTAQIAQPLHGPNGGIMPPWMLRAGIDRLGIPDLPSADVWGEYNDLPVSRVECSATDTGISTTVSFGRGPNLVEELTAQLERATEVAAVQ